MDSFLSVDSLRGVQKTCKNKKFEPLEVSLILEAEAEALLPFDHGRNRMINCINHQSPVLDRRCRAGAQMVNTGIERSRRQMHITCSWTPRSHEEQNGDKRLTMKAPTLLDQRLVE